MSQPHSLFPMTNPPKFCHASEQNRKSTRRVKLFMLPHFLPVLSAAGKERRSGFLFKHHGLDYSVQNHGFDSN